MDNPIINPINNPINNPIIWIIRLLIRLLIGFIIRLFGIPRTSFPHSNVSYCCYIRNNFNRRRQLFRSAHGRMTEYSQTMVTKLDFAAQVADSGYMAAITILPVIFMAGLTAVFFL